MPDNNNQPLPPLEEEAFKHGEKYQAEVINTKCPHDSVKLKSSTELKCLKCPAGWSGAGIMSLYNEIQARNK